MTRCLAILACCAVLACAPEPAAPVQESQPPAANTTASPAPAQPASATPREVVEDFGRRMKEISTLAPSDVVIASLRKTYSGLVTPELLRKWESDPSAAPGRQTSSPWPDRIEVQDASVTNDTAVVAASIVEMTSSGESRRVPVRLTLHRGNDGWRISDYQIESETGADAASAVEVVKSYYAAISARDYERAYAFWGPTGPPNQTLEQFRRGFAEMASVRVETKTPSRIEPAAGSRYVEVPVTVIAQTTSGETQRFEGTYTLRRTVVDGAPAAAREWHINKAALHAASS